MDGESASNTMLLEDMPFLRLRLLGAVPLEPCFGIVDEVGERERAVYYVSQVRIGSVQNRRHPPFKLQGQEFPNCTVECTMEVDRADVLATGQY